MSEEVAIRLPEATESAALLTLLEQLQGESDTFVLADAADRMTAAQEAEQLRQIQHSSRHLLLVASLGRELLGVCSISPTTQGHVGELGVAVLQNYWHQGIGTALVDEALYWAETASSLDAVGLTVQTRNVAAVKLYEKLGFERTDMPTETVTTAEGEQVTAVQMVFPIQPASD
ncbi:acetyltransferase [Levilactobacillus senmaizukei DSM 21775 = NBRC 103853]|uniref:Acetyltransferase n=1 Tax=Levilactobacillus senmaizukei DSM 21775 = NBRC 103853 TaxID=1423803 RepID=A0A0R2DGD8_9LACO|nr:GNAT family N-acetyltransferase [Levilactobacillus senmaizukei]KRN02403.1 acetyltransferase [Levilactobacillus senmaizukei DSM 21775 = NBRC 103853]